jgi:hypothetical protein
MRPVSVQARRFGQAAVQGATGGVKAAGQLEEDDRSAVDVSGVE